MNTTLAQSIETLKTVTSHVNLTNEHKADKLAEIVNATNLVLKATLWYSNALQNGTEEEQRMFSSNLKSDKLKLIALISLL